MKKNKKSQVAFEFMTLIALAIVILVSFLALLNQQIKGISLNEDRVAMRNLGNGLRDEIVLASQVHANYIRHFSIPRKLNGQDYSVSLLEYSNKPLKHTIMMNMSGNIDYFTLPVDVKGQFVDVENGFLDYCLVKGSSGDIVISRNQISLEYAGMDMNGDGKIAYPGEYDLKNKIVAGILQVPKGRTFSLYITVNCVEDLQSANFLLKHPSFSYVDYLQAWNHKETEGYPPHQIYGDVMFGGSTAESKAFFNADRLQDSTRITISHAGQNGPTGYDALVELVFKADKSSVETGGISYIRIDDFGIVDAAIKDIPPSKQDVAINVI